MFGVKTFMVAKAKKASLRAKFCALSLGQQGKKLRTGGKQALFTFSDRRSDQDVPRYQYTLVKFFADNGYTVYLYKKVDFAEFLRLGHFGWRLYAMSNVKFVSELPENTRDIFYVFDGEDPEDPLLNRPWKKLVYFNSMKPVTWTIGRETLDVPYGIYPHLYHYGQHRRLQTYRTSERKVRVFFAGNAVPMYYNNPVLKKYGQMTRLEAMNSLLEARPDIRHRPDKNEFDALWKGAYKHECVLADFTKFKIPPKDWLGILSKADFFICFSGTDFPMSHNTVESLAVGTIPIISYGDWFDPPLENKKNALVYTDKKDLARKVEEAMNMSADEIALLKSGAQRYYDEHLSPESFMRRFEETGETPTLVQMRRLLVTDADEAGNARMKKLQARIAGLKRSALHV